MSELPLYCLEQCPERKPEGNAGLWFDKFCNQWQRESGAWTMKSFQKDESPKLNWLSTLTGKQLGTKKQIEEAACRLRKLTTRRGGCAHAFVLTSRFATGLGRSHPVENGFAWHPTLGTPYLPGSSVKGLVRAWARTDAEPSPDGATRNRLLGCREQSGAICFLDAIPTAPVKLEADVMTPHYAQWNANDLPGDWRSPTPIPFLVTAPRTQFLFSFAPRTGAKLNKDDLTTISCWLESALEWAGAGAKTAVGYGRFQRDERTEATWREQQQEQQMASTPAGRWQLGLQKLSEAEVLDRVLENLLKEGGALQDAAERRAFAEAVQALGFPPHWKRGKAHDPKTGVGRKKLKERAQAIEDALKASQPQQNTA